MTHPPNALKSTKRFLRTRPGFATTENASQAFSDASFSMSSIQKCQIWRAAGRTAHANANIYAKPDTDCAVNLVACANIKRSFAPFLSWEILQSCRVHLATFSLRGGGGGVRIAPVQSEIRLARLIIRLRMPPYLLSVSTCLYQTAKQLRADGFLSQQTETDHWLLV